MSNKLTRKGITFGTILAFAISGLVGVMPAQAAQSLTLGPVAGSTLESIRESGVWIRADIAEATEGFKFRITSQTSGYTTDQLFDDVTDGDVTLTALYADTPVIGHNVTTGALVEAVEDSLTDAEDIPTTCTPGKTVGLEGGTIVVSFFENTGCTSNEASGDREDDTYFNATNTSVMYLGIKAVNSASDTDLVVDVRSHIDAGVYDDNNDTNNVGLADGDNQINAGEVVSTVSRVTLYDRDNVTATTAIEELANGQTVVSSVTFNKPKLNTYFLTTFNQGSRVTSAFYDASSENTVADVWNWSMFEPQPSAAWVTAENAKTDKSNVYNFPLEATSTGTASVGNYAARAAYSTGGLTLPVVAGNWVKWLGARSANSAIIAGNNALVDGVYAIMTESANVVDFTDGFFGIREGTKTATVTAQIVDGDEDLAASNVRVKAVFSKYYFDDQDTTISFAGSTSVIDEDSEEVTLYGRTDAKGQASFTFTSTSGDALDEIEVHLYALESDGDWVDREPTDLVNPNYNFESNPFIQWQEAFLYDFEVNPSGPVSGSSISLTYTASDQFGVGISNPGTSPRNAFEVTLIGTDDELGALDEDALRQTKALVNGQATFTFDNYAALDSFVWVAGILHQAGDEDIDARSDGYSKLTANDDLGYYGLDNWTSADSGIDTQVFKNDATAEIASVDNQYRNVVSYSEFRAGNYDKDAKFAEWVDTYGAYAIADRGNDGDTNGFEDYVVNETGYEYVQIAGTVETKNGNGAVAQEVTVSGAGLQFEGVSGTSGDYVFAIGSITLKTDVDGNFDFWVLAHKENLAGQSITISSGGKSFTTKLITYMNRDIDDEEYWNGTAWVDAGVLTSNWNKVTGNAPANNTVYNITVTAKDVWGNILAGAEVGVHDEDNVFFVSGSSSSDGEDLEIVTDSKGKASFEARVVNNQYANRNALFEWYADLHDYDYRVATALEHTFSVDNEGYASEFDATSFGSGREEVEYAGFTGPQARVAAGAKKGVVRVSAFNVKGKTVRVYVSGKLVKTVVSDKAKFLTKVKGVKSGDKRVTVKVGAKRMITAFVSVK